MAQPSTESQLARAQHGLQQFLARVRTIIGNHDHQPVPGSPAAIDRNDQTFGHDAWQGQPHEQTDVQAELSLLAAIQHLEIAAADCGRRPAPSWTLLRGGLEAAAWTRYLACPDVTSVAERSRRGINESLYGFFQQWRALHGYEEADGAQEKLDAIERILAAAAGFPDLGAVHRAHERKRPSAPYLGTARPTISQVIDEILPASDGRRFGTWVYAAMSAPAHAAAHGFAMTGSLLIQGEEQVLSPDAVLIPERFAMHLLPVLQAVIEAGGSVAARYAWPWADAAEAGSGALASWISVASPSA